MLCTTASYAFTKTDACHILIKKAIKNHFSSIELPDGYYDCISDDIQDGRLKHYFIFQLHYISKTPTNNDGSNLVGWYAIDKISGKLFHLDIAELKIGDAIDSTKTPTKKD